MDAQTKRHIVEGGAVLAVGALAYYLIKSGGAGGALYTVPSGAQNATVPSAGISTPNPTGPIQIPSLGTPGAIILPGNTGTTLTVGGDSNTGPYIGGNTTQTYDVPQAPFNPGGDNCCDCGCDTGAGDMNVFGSSQNLNAYLTGVLNSGDYPQTLTPAVAKYVAGSAYNNGGLTSAALGDT
jgi:hypothetical protein